MRTWGAGALPGAEHDTDAAGATSALDVVGDAAGVELDGGLPDGGSLDGGLLEDGTEVVGGAVEVGDGVTGVHTTVNSAVAVPSANCVGPPLQVKLAVKCPGRCPARPWPG
ncbi:MAG TPA: hypothetical protein VFG87_16390 [Amycolatopsis sp.]|jgi:hypothetical protein|nr:hypothetical protein [Amycolatopsis sp.]